MTRMGRLWDILRVATLGVWVLVFAWLLVGHHLPGKAPSGGPPYLLYIRAGLWPLLALGGVLLLAFTLATLPRLGRGGGSTGNIWGTGARTSLLLIPLVYAFGAPSGGLSGFAFDQRYVSDATFSGMSARTPAEDGKATLVDIVAHLDALVGRSVETEVRVMLGEDWPPGHFMAYRFVIVCCAADARPVGVLVKLPVGTKVEQDQWARVTGVVRTREGKSGVEPVIEAERIEPIDPLTRPYLYPS